MEYILDGKVHKGFQQVYLQRDIAPGTVLVIAWFDGEPDLWLVENHEGFKALKKYYSDEWGAERVTYQCFIASHIGLVTSPMFGVGTLTSL